MNMYRLVYDDDVIDHMVRDVIIDYVVCLRSHPLLLNNKLKILLMGTSVDVQVISVFIVTALCMSCDHIIFSYIIHYSVCSIRVFHVLYYMYRISSYT